MKQVRLIMMLLASVLFFACSDDELAIRGEVDIPQEVDLMKLEMWSYEVPFRVESDSEWRIETTGSFCYAIPSEGTGSATVKLCVVDNFEQNRQDGELRIIFPKDRKKDITLKMQQKYEGDYDDNAVGLNTGNRVYAVGYGYNTTGGYANPESVKRPILRFADMAEEELIVLGSVNASFSTKTYTSSSIEQLSNELATSASVDGGFGKFKGEIETSFNSNNFRSSTHEYALTYIDLPIRYVNVEANLEEMRDTAYHYMLTAAYDAINGLNSTNKGEEGVQRLIKDYGTHLCVNARLGGRIRHSMAIDISQVDDAYDAGLYAAASYSQFFVSAGGSVDEKFKKSFEKNTKACEIRVNVLGGSQKEAVALSDKLTEANLNAWKGSVTESTMALVSFSNSVSDPSLIPLYELVDVNRYPARYEEVKNYLENNIAKDYPSIGMSYDCGTVTHFKVPKFDANGTLVKQVKIDGQVVAQICEEYIPVINKDARVKVIYPVISNKARHNMGLFIGNASHRPARVSWEGNTLAVREYSDMKLGELAEVYIKGASITVPDPINKKSTVEGTVADEYMEGYRGTESGNYPIVKIFNKYWTREDYKGTITRGGDKLTEEKQYVVNEKNNVCFYRGDLTRPGRMDYSSNPPSETPFIAPERWCLPTEQDFGSIQSTLKDNGVAQIGKEFFSNGRLGFNAFCAGMCINTFNNTVVFHEDETNARYWLRYAEDYKYVRMDKSGGFEFGDSDWRYYHPMRFVKE